jgi:hypothetical protein
VENIEEQSNRLRVAPPTLEAWRQPLLEKGFSHRQLESLLEDFHVLRSSATPRVLPLQRRGVLDGWEIPAG